MPLAIDEAPVSAALNIYAQQPAAFDEAGRSAATRIGTYAAVAAGNLHAYHNARDTAANLEAALQSRPVIDQAKGILMERFKLTGDDAFQLLAHVSMRSNVKLREIADHLVTTGELFSGDPRALSVPADRRRGRVATAPHRGADSAEAAMDFPGACGGQVPPLRAREAAGPPPLRAATSRADRGPALSTPHHPGDHSSARSCARWRGPPVSGPSAVSRGATSVPRL